MQGGAPSCHNLAMTAELRDRRHPSAYVQQVAANVRAECARQGYSASQLGRAIFMNRASVSARWRGEVPWQLEDIERVSRLLGVTPALLCAARDSNPEPASWFHRLAKAMFGRPAAASRAGLAPVVDLVSRERVA